MDDTHFLGKYLKHDIISIGAMSQGWVSPYVVAAIFGVWWYQGMEPEFVVVRVCL
jgi:hypothetical protein